MRSNALVLAVVFGLGLALFTGGLKAGFERIQAASDQRIEAAVAGSEPARGPIVPDRSWTGAVAMTAGGFVLATVAAALWRARLRRAVHEMSSPGGNR